ncbi:MAG: PAS domain S-box protein, partial [SAR324 cluster bacterium]|nr:PAS domain S-box protein [SAR324 cluster bacterium]
MLVWQTKPLENIIGHDISTFLEPGSLYKIAHPISEKTLDLRANNMANGITSTYELCLKNKDGKYIWVEETSMPHWNKAEQRVDSVIIAGRDITERKESEAEILKLQKRLDNIFISMPSILIGVDENGVVTDWNYQAERATNTKQDDARGQLFTDVYSKLASEMDNVTKAIKENKIREHSKFLTSGLPACAGV